jgi:NADP-dependent 3-hydroxy acid dehydrogenase YdfG
VRVHRPRAAALAREDAPPSVMISGATSGIGFETALLLADKV